MRVEAWGSWFLFCSKGWTEVGIEAMRLNKFDLRGSRVLKTEQCHSWIIMSVRENWIQPYGLAMVYPHSVNDESRLCKLFGVVLPPVPQNFGPIPTPAFV